MDEQNGNNESMEKQENGAVNKLNEAQASAEESISVLGGLLDFGFKEFITTKVIKIIYIVGIVLLSICGLGMIISTLVQSFVAGIVAMVIVPLIILLYIIFIRISLELTIVIFNIARDIKKIADSK